VLGNCPDFREEKNALAHLIERRGHFLLLSVKCHPEMAGCGVEYCWGISKETFRKNNQISKLSTSDLQLRIEETLSQDILPLSRVWQFERRTRTYMHMYREIGMTDSVKKLSYKNLEAQMLTYTTHRNIQRAYPANF
jgi:hypothetical protein